MEEEAYFTWGEILEGKHFRKNNPDPVAKPVLAQYITDANSMLSRGFMGNAFTFFKWSELWWKEHADTEQKQQKQECEDA